MYYICTEWQITYRSSTEEWFCARYVKVSVFFHDEPRNRTLCRTQHVSCAPLSMFRRTSLLKQTEGYLRHFFFCGYECRQCTFRWTHFKITYTPFYSSRMMAWRQSVPLLSCLNLDMTPESTPPHCKQHIPLTVQCFQSSSLEMAPRVHRCARSWCIDPKQWLAQK